jgi:hypothetical protein
MFNCIKKTLWNDFPAVLEGYNSYYRVHSSPPLDPADILSPVFYMFHLFPGFTCRPFPSGLPTKTMYVMFMALVHATSPPIPFLISC